jgi:hypothetical protein
VEAPPVDIGGPAQAAARRVLGHSSTLWWSERYLSLLDFVNVSKYFCFILVELNSPSVVLHGYIIVWLSSSPHM